MKRHFASRAALEAAMATGEIQAGAFHLVVLHDDACTPGICVCEPEFILEDLTPENYMAGQRAQADWKRSKTS